MSSLASGVSDLEALRAILLTQDRAHLESLQDELESLRAQSEDGERILALIEPLLTSALAERARSHPQEFAEAIRPAIGPALRKQVLEERESIIAALTPIIGRTIQRAMVEALASLARRIDARMQRAAGLNALTHWFQARAHGVGEDTLALREALPWQVDHVFLIHNTTGLVLAQQSVGAEVQDADLVAALLTAIRSFAHESFRGEAGDTLHEIQYGDQLILLEEGRHAYLALVGRGVPPADMFQLMRETLSGIEMNQPALLRDFRGDPGADELCGPYLAPLLTTQKSVPARPPTLGLLLVLVFLLALLLGCSWLTYRASPRVLAHLAPTAMLYISLPTATATPIPTPAPIATPVSTASPTLNPTHTPTGTATPLPTMTPTPADTLTPTPVLGLMAGNVYLRAEPDLTTPRTNQVLRFGAVVRVIERRPPWLRVAYPATGEPTLDGWIPARWVLIAP